MVDKIKEYMEKYHMLNPGDAVTVGVSGGADSVCLLFLLSRLREEYLLDKNYPKEDIFSLTAVHVHHGIRKEAGEDEAYVRSLCEKLKVPLVVYYEDVPKYARENGLSTEEAGRILRYRDFQKTAGPEGKIAVAHNCNDKAETLLFHLFRGTGLRGACSIKPVNGNIIRPLLCIPREDIEKYLKEISVKYQTDRTNLENNYARNRIRNQLLPFAEKEICQGAGRHLSEAAEKFLEAQEYIDGKTRESLEECYDKQQCLIHVGEFAKLDNYMKEQVLLMVLEQVTNARKDITAVHIGGILKLLSKTGNGELNLPYGVLVRKEYEELYFRQASDSDREADSETKSLPVCSLYKENKSLPLESIDIPGLGMVEISVLSYKKNTSIIEKTYTKWFHYDKISSNILFRTRTSGDYLMINSKMEKKSLKEYMINEKIPQSRRKEMYLLADGSHIVWIPGYRISEYYKVNESTRKILQMKIRDLDT